MCYLILLRLWLLWYLKNQNLSIFYLKKNMFFNSFLPKTPIKHFRKYDKHIYDLNK